MKDFETTTILFLKNLKDGTTIDLKFSNGVYRQITRVAGQVSPIIVRITDGKRAAAVISLMYDTAMNSDWSVSNDRVSCIAA